MDTWESITYILVIMLYVQDEWDKYKLLNMYVNGL